MLRRWMGSALLGGMTCLAFAPGRAIAQEAPAAEPATTMARAAHEMAHSAEHLVASLTDEQKQRALFDFSDEYRYDWHFIPRDRRGLPWKEMNGAQRQLATALLASGLSQRGLIKAATIMSLEQVLLELERGSGPVRDPELYYFSIFGEPASADHNEPWGFRVEGHHLSLNFTIVDGRVAVGGPTFMGSNPGVVRDGPRAGLRVLADEEDLARAFVKSLSDLQREKAIVSPEAPRDILSAAVRKAGPLDPPGLMASELEVAQAGELLRLVKVYSERLRPEISGADMEKILAAGLDKIAFAWAGSTEPGQPHYYRIQGPTFLIEYDNTQNDANHIHSVWRDLANDFGEDLLSRHYEQHADADGTHKH